jgi:hypothetical protein
VEGVAAIPLQHNGRMRARLHLLLSAWERSAKGMAGISVIVEDKIRMPAFALEPALDLGVLLGNRGADGNLSGVAIIPGGRRGDVALTIEPLAELVVGASDMLAEGMPASGFVLREVAARAFRIMRNGSGAGSFRPRSRLLGSAARGCEQYEDRAHKNEAAGESGRVQRRTKKHEAFRLPHSLWDEKRKRRESSAALL